KAYLHRSGRTARAGASGTVVTIALPAQRKDLVSVLRRADINAPIERTAAHSPEVTGLVGTLAERAERKPLKDESRTFERGERGPGRPGRRQARPVRSADAGEPGSSTRKAPRHGAAPHRPAGSQEQRPQGQARGRAQSRRRPAANGAWKGAT